MAGDRNLGPWSMGGIFGGSCLERVQWCVVVCNGVECARLRCR